MFEILKIHGIELKYPEEWVIHPITKLERLRGELAFSLNIQKATPTLMLSWKPLEQSKRKYNSTAAFYNVKVTLYKPALIMVKPKFTVKIVKFAMLFCEESDRSIIIYSETEETEEKEDLFKEILSSLICHQPKILNK